MKVGKGRLKGVEVRIYQGGNGWWHTHILLDKDVWGYSADYYGTEPPKGLPRYGNRPRTDSGSNRWWYDFSAHSREFHTHHSNSPRIGIDRTNDEMIAHVRADIVDVLVNLLGNDVRLSKVIEAVEDIPLNYNPWAPLND